VEHFEQALQLISSDSTIQAVYKSKEVQYVSSLLAPTLFYLVNLTSDTTEKRNCYARAIALSSSSSWDK